MVRFELFFFSLQTYVTGFMPQVSRTLKTALRAMKNQKRIQKNTKKKIRDCSGKKKTDIPFLSVIPAGLRDA